MLFVMLSNSKNNEDHINMFHVLERISPKEEIIYF